MTVVDLGGHGWELTDVATGSSYAARVPGSVLLDLIRAGVVDDPFFRENEKACAWVGEREWHYRRRFDAADVIGRRHQLLRFHGLDTLATVRLNGDVVLDADNMHRRWEVDVTDRLRETDNELEVVFASPMAEVRARQTARPLPGWHSIMCVEGTGWLRKQLSNFGWDWGPALVTAGIWRRVELIGYDDALLADVEIRQRHRDGRVELTVRARTSPPAWDDGSIVVELRSPDGGLAASTTAAGLTTDLGVEDPRLWWPRGLGAQPLYQLVVHLIDADGVLVDAWSRRLGLRTLRLARDADADGESFGFVCNGVPFFAKGANWIPADAVVGRATPADLRARLHDAADAHMNMLRVWGGGVYEEDEFYDACDELGICVWQDAAFACVTFPGFDPAYVDSVRLEFEDNVRRLRHHPSLALWCGNNELEMGLVGDAWTESTMSWSDYRPLMDDVLADVVRRLDPQRDYWPASPHTPGAERADANSATAGDAHLWAVWHGGRPASWYRSSEHRFVSEFGFESMPHPATIAEFTVPADRDVASPVMDAHQKARAAGATGTAELMRTLVQRFRTPATFDDLVWQTQLVQAAVVTTGIEHWRRSMARTRGTLYWQLNDCWPGPSWSSVDSSGRWKALHYAVRRAYAPVLLSLVEDTNRHVVDVHVTSDLLTRTSCTLDWALVHTGGRILDASSQRVDVEPQRAVHACTVEAAEVVRVHGTRNVLFFASLREHRKQRAVTSFVPPKHLSLEDPRLAVVRDGRSVTVRANRPALWVWLDAGDTSLRASDNFFCLPPGSYTVDVDADEDVPLTVRSLVSTVQVNG